MEVRKYSAEYHQLDTQFRKPNLELISAYAIQNPFLYGAYALRYVDVSWHTLYIYILIH